MIFNTHMRILSISALKRYQRVKKTGERNSMNYSKTLRKNIKDSRNTRLTLKELIKSYSMNWKKLGMRLLN
jgi:hypothetical protein